MAEINDAEQPSGRRDKHTGMSTSAANLKRILGDSRGYRNLTRYEIELLRKSKREMDLVVGEVLAGKTVAEGQDET